MTTEGLWIQTESEDGKLFSDSAKNDGVIRTGGTNQKILIGFGDNGTVSLSSELSLVRTNLTIKGDLDIDSALTVSGSNVMEDIALLKHNSEADSNVPPSKIQGVLPVSVGGTGAIAFPDHSIPFGADDKLDTSEHLTFDDDTSTLKAENAKVSRVQVGDYGIYQDPTGDLVVDSNGQTLVSFNKLKQLLEHVSIESMPPSGGQAP